MLLQGRISPVSMYADIIFRDFDVLDTFLSVTLTAVSKAHNHGILCETTKAVCHSEAIVCVNLLHSMQISLSLQDV